jgi:hypothetical protein
MSTPENYAAFADSELILQSDLIQVARRIKSLVDARDPRTLLVFAYPTGMQVDLDLRGSLDDVLASLYRATPEPASADEPKRRSPGRPKLGVVGREVTLLPRHWDWLNAQPGGASVALRKLVEQARKGNQGADRVRQSREAAFRFMSAIAGNEPGFEEASRALFGGDREAFDAQCENWPVDVRDFARSLATDGFEPD